MIILFYASPPRCNGFLCLMILHVLIIFIPALSIRPSVRANNCIHSSFLIKINRIVGMLVNVTQERKKKHIQTRVQQKFRQRQAIEATRTLCKEAPKSTIKNKIKIKYVCFRLVLCLCVAPGGACCEEEFQFTNLWPPHVGTVIIWGTKMSHQWAVSCATVVCFSANNTNKIMLYWCRLVGLLCLWFQDDSYCVHPQ